MKKYDIVVIGGGPAGLAAINKASANSRVLLVEREAKLGGILKQCIHDGFGVTRFKEKLSGPEYAHREIASLSSSIDVLLLTFVTKIERVEDGYILSLVNRDGVANVHATKLIFATGCRERTSKQVNIHGTNPSGVMSAGQAQYYINILGQMPGKNFVILGSGDIGLIMARRITLEGGKVIGVFEAKSTPSGLSRNIAQCLDDFSIPLHLSTTVTRVFGVDRLEAVEISNVDEHMAPIKGTEKIIPCDSLILSVGLIPENELIGSLGVEINPKTKGPSVDQCFMTTLDNVYCCGNAVHVNDLADYVSESGEIAGGNASNTDMKSRKLIDVSVSDRLLYVVPNKFDVLKGTKQVIFYFRSKEVFHNQMLVVLANDKPIFKKVYSSIRPPEMERIVVDLTSDVYKLEIVLGDRLK